MSAKLHRLFDEEKWLLLPETKIVDQYYEHYREGGYADEFPVIQVRLSSTASIRNVVKPDMYVRIFRSTTPWLPTQI